MNDLVRIDTMNLTMSSREIAEVVESRHDSVKRSMETLRDKGIISFTQTVETSHEGAGARPIEVYSVSKRDSYVVVAQLSPEFTARLVDRWQKLEQQLSDPMRLLNDPAYMRGLLSNYCEKVLVLEQKVAEQEPKVAAFESIKGAHGSLCFRDTAKTIPVKEAKLKIWLLAKRWAYTRPGKGRLIGTSEAQAKGYVNHKLTTRTFEDGTTEEYAQMMITPRGLAKLAIEFARNGLAA